MDKLANKKKAVMIAFVNNKGGVTKTASTVNVASDIHLRNKDIKILLVDTDSQGNISRSFNLNSAKLSPTMYDVFMNDVDPADCIVKDVYENIDILPSNSLLNFLEFDTFKLYTDNQAELIYNIGRVIENEGKRFEDLSIEDIESFIPKNADPAFNYFNRLEGKFDKLAEEYDFIIFDTPPELKSVTSSVLSIVDVVFIPYEPDVYSMDGIKNILDRINAIVEEYNNNLKIGGLFATKYRGTTNLHKSAVLDVVAYANKNNLNWFSTNIPHSIKVSNATAYNGLPTVLLGKKNNVTDAYHELVTEMINKGLFTIKEK